MMRETLDVVESDNKIKIKQKPVEKKKRETKKDEKKSYESIHVVKVDLNKFLEKDLEEEILDIKGTGEII